MEGTASLSYATPKQKYLDVAKISLYFVLVLAVGYALGYVVPPVVAVVLLPMSLIMLFVGIFMKFSRKVSLGMYLTFYLLLGIALNTVVTHYVSQTSATVVGTTALGVFTIFVVFSLIGAFTKTDLSSMLSMLFVGFMVMLALTLVNIFILQSELVGLAISAVLCLLYMISMIVDINAMKNSDFDMDEAPHHAFNLILNPIGLFIRALDLTNIFDGF